MLACGAARKGLISCIAIGVNSSDKAQAVRESSRARQRDDRVGTLVHEVLASLLSRQAPVTVSSVRNEVDARLPVRLASVYRQAIRQRVVGASMIYETEFRETTWQFAGAEMIIGDSALDLVWVAPGGFVYADEIKSGLAAVARLDQITAQCRAQFAAGTTIFGRRFAGVRAILLTERRIGSLTAESQEELKWAP